MIANLLLYHPPPPPGEPCHTVSDGPLPSSCQSAGVASGGRRQLARLGTKLVLYVMAIGKSIKPRLSIKASTSTQPPSDELPQK